MHKFQQATRNTMLCHDTSYRAPALFLAHLKSFFSESQSPYFRYGSFAILKNNCSTALKCVSLVAVDYMWTSLDNYHIACVQKVHNYEVIQALKKSFSSCTHVIHQLRTVLMNNIFVQLTLLKDRLYTLSTMPIITIYFYKGDYII